MRFDEDDWSKNEDNDDEVRIKAKTKFGSPPSPWIEWWMTYGWALLVLLLAIGVLAYYGVLAPPG